MMKKEHPVGLFIEKHIFLLSGAWLLWVVWLIIYALREGGAMDWFHVFFHLISVTGVTAITLQHKRARDKGQ